MNETREGAGTRLRPKTSRVARQRGRPFHANPLLAPRLPRWRSIVVQCLLLCGFGALAARAVWLQLVSDDFLQRQGAYRYARTLVLPGTRGQILDRDGALLAASVPAVSVWAIPEALRGAAPERLDALAAALGMERAELDRRIGGGRQIVYLARERDPVAGRALMKLGVPGVGLTGEFRRVYPQGAVTSQLVGFVGRDGAGLEGCELAHQARLSGVPGLRRVIKDRLGNIVDDMGGGLEPRPGRDTVLSISSQLQYVAYTQLQAAVETFQAKAGGAIVVDARSGDILALANYPSYDPSQPVRPGTAALRNRAITDTYEPGAVMKTFTVALAIERGKVTPDSMIDTGAGRLVISGAPISDTSAHGLISVSEVLKYSSNIGTAKLALALPPREMWEMFTGLGFGQAPQLGFPGAAAGRVRPHASWRPMEQATMSYGNGIAVSLLQLARAYTVFADDGRVIPLTLEKGGAAPPGTRVFSPATAR